jgi:hypothetical protein
MVMTPTFFLADFQTGNILGETLPLERVSLSSSQQPGQFSATLDLRKLGALGEGYRVMDLLKNGKCTLVPVREALSTGTGNPLISRELGEWWIAEVADSPPSPFVTLSGPEFAGYAKEAQLIDDFIGTSVDPVVAMRQMLWDLYTTSQTVTVDLQSWISHTGARIEVDAPRYSTSYWDAIADMQEADGGPFEWVIRSGLVQVNGSPRRVTRTLEVGQPILSFSRPDITLELAGPGRTPASITGFSRSRSEHRTTSAVYARGAGAGQDQIGPVGVGRSRATGEPLKSRTITDPQAGSLAVLRRRAREALYRLSPELQVWPAHLPTDRYTPRTGERYSWRTDAQWSRPAESGQVRCVGWSWSSSGADEYVLQLSEVS